MSIQLDREVTQDLGRAASVEWLETNGLGGGAGTTVAGLNSRREHGLLVAATPPDGQRSVLLSRLDETIHVDGGSFDLGCNQFPGTIAPRGFEHLVSFTRDLFPSYEYEAGGVRLRKTVAAVDGENTTLVLYEALDAPGPFILSLRPFVAARDARTLASANPGLSQEISFADGVLRLHPYEELPEVFLAMPGTELLANPQWWYRFEYEADRRRGIDFQEDLWTPGLFGCALGAGDSLGVIVSTVSPAGRDAFALYEKERRRREKILAALPVQDGLARHLGLLADSFLVRRGAQRTVNAGSLRDTLVSLPGLCLTTGRHEDAKRILRSCLKARSEESLWLFVAAWKYFQATEDEAFARGTLLPALRKLVHAFTRQEVEDKALWYNALEVLAGLETRLGDPVEAMQLHKQAKKVQKEIREVSWTALALPFSPLPKVKAAKVLEAVSPEEVEPGLLGPYLSALVRVNGPAGRKKAKQIVSGLELAELDLGGAAGVAELLRAYVEDVQGTAETKRKP